MALRVSYPTSSHSEDWYGTQNARSLAGRAAVGVRVATYRVGATAHFLSLYDDCRTRGRAAVGVRVATYRVGATAFVCCCLSVYYPLLYLHPS